jgi:hypothetical protein
MVASRRSLQVPLVRASPGPSSSMLSKPHHEQPFSKLLQVSPANSPNCLFFILAPSMSILRNTPASC